jgi:hypothetical protein
VRLGHVRVHVDDLVALEDSGHGFLLCGDFLSRAWADLGDWKQAESYRISGE